MRILICDDDSSFTAQLEQYLCDYFRKHRLKLPEIYCYTDGEELLNDPGEKDIVFLDIEMPGRSGISVGRQLSSENSKTLIFMVTAFAEYLDDAMRFRVFRYLSKPLDKNRLYRNLQDALSEYALRSSKTIIETRDGVTACLTSEIICLETQGRRVIVHTTQGDFESIQNMRHWQSELTQLCFFQCHRSYIVNMAHVISFTRDMVQLCGGLQAYLTRRRYSAFKASYMLYLASTRS